MLAVIGLAGVFVIVIMMYIFTGLLEKCLVNTNKFQKIKLITYSFAFLSQNCKYVEQPDCVYIKR